MPGTTTELGLATAIDQDDNADYLTINLADSLRTVDALFNNVTGHNHGSAHQGGPITSIPAGSIPDGSITSAKIADGTIATADIGDSQITTLKIAANAATFRFRTLGVTTTPSTTSATAVDMPDMIYTFTPPVISDFYVDFTASVLLSGAGSYATFGLVADGTTQPITAYFQQVGLNGTVNIGYLLPGQSATSHTIKIQWNVLGGGTITANGALRGLTILGFQR